MKQFAIAEAKSHFSEIVKIAESGTPVRITRGKKKETVAYLVPPKDFAPPQKRELGIIEHWGKIKIADDWKMTDEEFLGL